MKHFLINSKGGVGKSYITKLHSLKAEKEKVETYFLDCDNASASSTKFFNGIKDKKSKYLKVGKFNLIGNDKKIDRTKFDTFLSEIEKYENLVVDFGASSSEQLLYYIMEEEHNDLVQIFKEMNIRLFVVFVGGGSAKECVEFFELLKKIPRIEEITHIIANEFHGGIKGMSVKDYTQAKVQIGTLHEDSNSEAQKEWNQLMTDGIVYNDILNISLIRRRRIVNYLDKIFNQLNTL
ncbi:MAG: hypothetical protein O9294_11955 [Cytophagales bacterium]|jgi:hypothetical protein|nr:hypothetical protein [Cytophagales bacterium]